MALEEFTSRGSRDFRQRYQGVYGWYPTGEKEILVHVDIVEGGYMKFSDRSGITYTAIADKGVEFKFLPVERKLFRYGEQILCMKRHPARQWQRGISSANTSAIYIYTGTSREITFPLLEAYLNTDYEAEAAKLDDGGTSSVLSSMVAIHNGLVYIYDLCVGTYYNKLIVLDTDLFSQEIQDTLKRHNLNVKVEVK